MSTKPSLKNLERELSRLEARRHQIITILTAEQERLDVSINLIKEKLNGGLTGDPVETLNFSTRVLSCLRSENIQTIPQLLLKTEEDLLRIPNFGKGCLAEVKEALAARGLALAGTSRSPS